jgi:pyruvate ferredoxin oxidoreductase alpha subunit
MTEVLYASAGLRLPFVITGVNRAISAPISIQVDYQDTVSLRDAGIIQIYVESSQEAYDTHIAAFKIAEDPRILLPVMVCMDGWILTHSYERVSTLTEDDISNFLPHFQPENMLDVENPKTWGSYAEEDVLMELKYSIHQAMIYARKRIKEIFSELSLITGRNYGGLTENYRTDDAEIVLVAMGSMTGTIKDAIDNFRADGQKIGLIKVRCYRPFPYEDVIDAIKGVKIVAVIEADFSMGSEGALAMDLKAKLYSLPQAPAVISVIGGVGGREVNLNTVEKIVKTSRSIQQKGVKPSGSHWEGLDFSILPEGA